LKTLSRSGDAASLEASLSFDSSGAKISQAAARLCRLMCGGGYAPPVGTPWYFEVMAQVLGRSPISTKP